MLRIVALIDCVIRFARAARSGQHRHMVSLAHIPLLSFLVMLAVGCIPDITPPKTANITCAPGAKNQCPSGLRCSESLERCVPAGQEADPPKVGAFTSGVYFYKAGSSIVVTFSADEALGKNPEVFVNLPNRNPQAMQLVPRTQEEISSNQYSFMYTFIGANNADGPDPEGPGSILVRMTDLVGNTGEKSFPNSFEVDNTGPQLADAPRRLIFLDPTNPHYLSDPIIDSNAQVTESMRADTEVQLFIAFRREVNRLDENSPGLRIEARNASGCVLPFVITEENDFNPSFFATLRYDEVSTTCQTPEGEYVVTIDATDLAGNFCAVQIDGLSCAQGAPEDKVVARFELDLTPPPEATVRFDRVPWGSGRSDDPLNQASFFVDADVVENDASLRLYDQPAGVANGIIATFNALGAQQITAPLAISDRTFIWYRSFDAAGNSTNAMRLNRGTWRASLRGRKTANRFSNPNAVRISSIAKPYVADPVHLEPSSTDIAAMATTDGTGLSVFARRIWRRQGVQSPPGLDQGSMVYVGHTGKTLAIGGIDAGFGEVGMWEFDGERWTALDFKDRPNPGGGRNPTLAYDSKRARVVYISTALQGRVGKTWEYDGRDWYVLTGEGQFSPVSVLGSATFAINSGLTILPFETRMDATCAGGLKLGFGDLCIVSTMWGWNGERWTKLCADCGNNRPAPRVLHGVTYNTGTGEVILFGGLGCTQASCANITELTELNDTWAFNGSSWRQLTGENVPGLVGANLIYDTAQNKVKIFGGCTALIGGNSDNFLDCSLCGESGDVYALNTEENWQLVQATTRACSVSNKVGATYEAGWAGDVNTGPRPRAYAMAAYDSGRDQLLVRGGATLWIEDEQATPTCPSECEAGTVRATGGVRCYCLPEDTMALKDGSWTVLTSTATDTRPRSQRQHALAYVPAEGRVWLFGGNLSDSFGDCDLGSGDGRNCEGLWSYDGRAWAEQSFDEFTDPTFRGRLGHGMATVTNPLIPSDWRVAVLFGALDGSAPTNAVITWGNGAWAGESFKGNAPDRRTAFAVAAIGDTVYIHGGAPLQGTKLYGDFWRGTFDFVDQAWTWVELKPGVLPSARARHAMVYDSIRSRLVLFGGCSAMAGNEPVRDCLKDDSVYFAETWEYNPAEQDTNARWALVDSGTTITPRAQFAMAYDPGIAR